MDGMFAVSTICLIVLVWKAVNSKNDPEINRFFISLAILILLSPAIVILIPVFAIYRSIIASILKLKHGSRFSGWLSGFEVLTIAKRHKMIINGVAIVHFKSKTKSVYTTIAEKMQSSIFDHPERHSRFMDAYYKYGGYYFRMRNDIGVSDCLRKMEPVQCDAEEVDEEQYMELITEYGNSQLPKDETVLWEIVVGTQPIKRSKKGKQNCDGKFYPVLVRVQHAISDGVSLLKFLTSVVADLEDTEDATPTDARNVPQADYKGGSFVDAVRYYALMVYSLVMAPLTIIEQLFVKGREENVVKGPLLSAKQFFAMVPEESTGYVEKIKRIKGKVPGATFADVLLTAYSVCLRDYFEQYTTFRPSYVTSFIPLSFGSSQVQRMVPGDTVNQKVGLGNTFSFIMPKLPIFTSNDSKPSLLNRLKLVMEETKYDKNLVEYQINIWSIHRLLGLLPFRLARKFQVMGTSYVGLLVGPPKLGFSDGVMQLESLSFWVHVAHKISVGLTCLTYDGRLQFGFSVDQALIPDNKAVMDVLRNVYKYLDLFEEEIDRLQLKNGSNCRVKSKTHL